MLLYDHRGHGKSDGDQLSGGHFESKDVLEAVKFLQTEKELSPKQIGLIGESWGAAAVLIAASENDELGFVLAESTYSSWEDAITPRAVKQFGSWVKAFTPMAFKFVEWRGGMNMDDAAPQLVAKNIKVPTLLVHSSADTLTTPDHSVRVAEHLDPTIGNAIFLDWDAWHAHNALARPMEYKQMLLDHFRPLGVSLCE